MHYISMVKGTIGAIVCPALEDELIYSLSKDKDPKNVYVLDNGETTTFLPKMKQYGVEYTMITKEQYDSCSYLDKNAYNVVVCLNTMKLHEFPDYLREELQKQLIEVKDRFDVIALYYGMCGNIGWDITQWAKELVPVPVTVFHDCTGQVCDDCIGVAVGGRAEYLDLMKKHTGQLFLTPAFACNWDVHTGLDDTWVGSFDSRDDFMRMMFEMGGYKHAVKVDTGIGDREIYDTKCEEVAKRMNLDVISPEQRLGNTKLADDLYVRTKAYLKD